MKKLIYLSIVICSILFAGVSIANETTNKEATIMDEMVVTAGRIKEQRRVIVKSIIVIDEEEMRQSSATNVGDILAQKGIGAIKKYPGALTSIGIRGFRTETHGNDLKGHVLILLNGRRAGTGNVAKIMTKNVARIEIIRGPASVQYGSAAVGGVINVITRKGEGEPSFFAEGSLGSFDNKAASIGFEGEINKFDFSGSITKDSRDDYTTGHGEKYHNTGIDSRENVSLNLGYEFFANNRIGIIYNNFQVDEAGSSSYLSQNDLDDYNDKSNYSFDIVLDGQTSNEKYGWLVRYFTGSDKDTWVDPTDSNPDGYDDGMDSWRKTDNQGAQAQLTAKFGITQLTAGMDWANYDVKASWNPSKTSYDNLAGFLLGKVKFIEERLILSAGLRYDTYEVAVIDPDGNTENDNNFTPNAGISFLLTDMVKLRAGYAQAFVMPSADHMAADFSNFGTNYVGNSDISPETSETWEGGIDLFYRSLSASVTYFYTDFKDKIESVTLSNGDRSWDNLGKAKIAGFEGNISFDIGDFFGWDIEVRPFAGFTFLTDYKDKETGDDLLETSDLTASYGIMVSDFKGFSARLNFAYYGEKTITDFENGWPYQDIKVDNFTIADFTISKELLSSKRYGSLTLDAAINNLFDKDYAFVKGYPMPGRSFYVGMRYDF